RRHSRAAGYRRSRHCGATCPGRVRTSPRGLPSRGAGLFLCGRMGLAPPRIRRHACRVTCVGRLTCARPSWPHCFLQGSRMTRIRTWILLPALLALAACGERSPPSSAIDGEPSAVDADTASQQPVAEPVTLEDV